MQIKDMFRKKIDREIQGVIIVGQGEETNVAQELEEYVVTRELQRHFADFFAAYKKGIQGTTPKMGVSVAARMASRLLELAVLHATMMAFTSFVSRKRTFCKENLVTASLDLLP